MMTEKEQQDLLDSVKEMQGRIEQLQQTVAQHNAAIQDRADDNRAEFWAPKPPVSAGMPIGEHEGQVCWWDASEERWMVSKGSAAAVPSVLVYDTDDAAGNKVRWEQLSDDYRGIFRSGDDAVSDVPRMV